MNKTDEDERSSRFQLRPEVVESFRTLATNLKFVSGVNGLNSMVVTSSIPEEGKTTVVTHLAVVLARQGLSVVLIDADLRKPSLHEVFGVRGRPGLTNCLLNLDSDYSQVLISLEDNLKFLPAGTLPPNPTDMVNSQAMENLLKDFKEECDYLLFDTPPVLAGNEARVLGARSDGVLLVVGSADAAIEETRKAKTSLERIGANILGVVLNKVEVESLGYYGYYGYGAQSEDDEMERDFSWSEEADAEAAN